MDHIGLAVPDVEEAQEYYNEFMPMVGYMPQFGTGYVPTDWQGCQLFLYPATEEGAYSRHRVGFNHLSFFVHTRAEVHRVYEWVKARGDEVIHEPKVFPEYSERFYATFFLDPHGVMLEVVTYESPDE